MDNVKSTFEFIIELEKLKAVQRRTKPVGLTRYENSAEHSWQVAVLAFALEENSNEKIEIGKVLKMLILHDVCEIDADDTFFYDEIGREVAKKKEAKAIERIFGMLPEPKQTEFIELWNEFENGKTAEANFARAIDRVMPILQNVRNSRQSWGEHHITKEMVLEKTKYIADGSAQVWELIEQEITEAFY
ncbi:MAG: HD domain-containing protein [Pyrinomonadaceae bacterium]